jgi:hypothetical protein
MQLWGRKESDMADGLKTNNNIFITMRH